MRAGQILVFALRRLLIAVPLLVCVVVVNFTLIELAPGDPITVLVGDYPAPEEYVAQVRKDFGLDQKLPQRLFAYLGQVGRGNLGFSFVNRQAVLDLILERLGATLALTLTSLAFATLAGVSLGALAAMRRGSALDAGLQTASLAGYSIPEFWIGQILIIVFAVWLGLLPSQGAHSLRAPRDGIGMALDTVSHLVLPALALSFRYLALISRMTRASLIEVMNADFILAARSRGASERRVLFAHAFRNAAAPVVTVIGYNLGLVLAGATLIESVFGWPGIGRLLFTSIAARDYPVMTGILLLLSATVVIANLMTDIVQAVIDPRVRRP
ncbi:peptide/nickel transport system permease protein [Rhizobiales bacterium GAS188]|nr:peptide/nickel transport system permease protein [Rhizobiales bacterium GAS188]